MSTTVFFHEASVVLFSEKCKKFFSAAKKSEFPIDRRKQLWYTVIKFKVFAKHKLKRNEAEQYAETFALGEMPVGARHWESSEELTAERLP